MRVIVIGLGVQGRKRRRIAGGDVVATVDVALPADHRSVEEVPLDRYEAALVCVPDAEKPAILAYLLERGKHALVEKPLLMASDAELLRLEAVARRQRAVCYTAYNHRFEPHFVRMRECIQSGRLGRIYLVRMFYGNGTARDVRESPWRDQAGGVLPDLGSHLIDTVRFWLGELCGDLRLSHADRFENAAYDHVAFSIHGMPRVLLEATLVCWRNHFTADVFGELGCAHIESLCKWGPSSFTVRDRVLPSGRPPEERITLVRPDPTWELEYAHFRALCAEGKDTSLADDLAVQQALGRLEEQAWQLDQA